MPFLTAERIKDKLARSARERLAQSSKDRQLQTERKRKAAMFINMLKESKQPGGGSEGQKAVAVSNTAQG